MLVMMRRSVFDSLDHAALGWACIEPTIQQIRGKNPNVKLQVYVHLTAGQRALLMFLVLYGHARSGVAQFFDEIDYLMAQADVWSVLKAGMRYFGDEAMLRVIEEMERVYRALVDGNLLGALGVGGDPELLATMNHLDTLFREIAPATLDRVGEYIRKHPGEFAQIND